MAAGAIFNVITIVISMISLAVSGTLAIRQMRTAKDGYALPVVLDVFSTFRTESYVDSERYVLHQMGNEFPNPIPYSDLPISARSHLWKVAGLYDDLANLVAHGVVSEALVVGSRGNTVIRVWEVLQPFVEQDRQQRGSNAFVFLKISLPEPLVRLQPRSTNGFIYFATESAPSSTTGRTPGKQMIGNGSDGGETASRRCNLCV